MEEFLLLKILHVISNLSAEKGGPTKAVTEMCEALTARGHEVSLFTTNMNNETDFDVPLNVSIKHNGYQIYYFQVGKFRKWSFSRDLMFNIQKHIHEFDIVHIHSLYLFHGFVVANYCRRFNIPYIIQPHGALDPFIRKKGRIKKAIYHYLIENRNLNHAAAIQYTAVEEMRLAHEQLGIKSPALVIPLGLNIREYSNLPQKGLLKARYPSLQGKFVLLFLGRITPKKGLDLLLKAFYRLKTDHVDLHLLIVGPEDPGYGDKVREWVRNYGIEAQVTFTGMLKGTEKLSAFVDSDIFILPSYSENFGLTILEAMICGLPVITTNKVNIWREIRNSEAAEIIPCEANKLEQALAKLILYPDIRNKYASNGINLVKQKYDWNSVVDDYIHAYQTILMCQEH